MKAFQNGIDLGVKELAVCSDEKRYKNINKTSSIKQLEKKKRRNAEYSVESQENMKKIRRENVTGKRKISRKVNENC